MDYPQFYIVFSISVGLLQVFDNVLLIQSKGHLTTPNAVISGVEFIWIIVSSVALFAFESVPKYLPLSYILFTVVGSIYGVFLFRNVETDEDEFLPKNMLIPLWLSIVGGMFGAYFAVANIIVHQTLFK